MDPKINSFMSRFGITDVHVDTPLSAMEVTYGGEQQYIRTRDDNSMVLKLSRHGLKELIKQAELTDPGTHPSVVAAFDQYLIVRELCYGAKGND